MAKAHNGEPTVRARSAEWLETRLEMLKAKKKTLKYDYDTRTANVEQEIKDRTSELKALSKGK